MPAPRTGVFMSTFQIHAIAAPVATTDDKKKKKK